MPLIIETKLRLRLAQHDTHYGGNIIDGAKILALFGDAATELLIRYDGDEGLFRAYDNIEFLAPVYAGDFLEINAQLIKTGNTSREMQFEAWKIISPETSISESAAAVLDPPILVCKATGVCVTPLDKQRITHE